MIRGRIQGLFGQKIFEKTHYENVHDLYFYPDEVAARYYPSGKQLIIEPVDNIYASGAENVRTGRDEDGFYIWYSYKEGFITHTVDPFGESKIVIHEESEQ